jgi:hypothetical protein
LRSAWQEVLRRDELALPIPEREHETIARLRTGRLRIIGSREAVVVERER